MVTLMVHRPSLWNNPHNDDGINAGENAIIWLDGIVTYFLSRDHNYWSSRSQYDILIKYREFLHDYNHIQMDTW